MKISTNPLVAAISGVSSRNPASLAGLALSTVLASVPAMAESVLQLEEVVVTAQKRVESLQEVPISVSAVDGSKMAEAGIQRLDDLQAYVPNLKMGEGSLGTSIFIRGMGSGVNQGFEQSVGMYIDGIYYGRSQLARVPFLDLERVEVLRGPQSILFGKNSIAGAVSMVTAKPSEEFEAEIGALVAPEDGEYELTGVVSGPITDSLRGRLAVRGYDLDGWMEDIYLDQEMTEKKERFARGTLAWDASENLDVVFKVEQGTFDSENRQRQVVKAGGVPYLQGENDFDLERAMNEGYSENDISNSSLVINYQLGEHTFTATSGYLSYEFEELGDRDASPLFILHTVEAEEYRQFSQELRLTSPGGETVDYIVGLFYQTGDLEYKQTSMLNLATLNLGPNLIGKKAFTSDSDLWAAFAQATWNINDAWALTGGVRYTQEDKSGTRGLCWTLDGQTCTPLTVAGVEPHFGANSLEADRTENSITPLLRLQYHPTDDTMVYASYSTGFKAGGFDATGVTRSDFEFEEEKAKTYELGTKTGLLDGAAELNVALFYTEFSDLQVSTFDGNLGFSVGNAAEAVTRGIELDGRWQLTQGLTLSGALAYLDFEFQDYDDGQCYRGQPTATPGMCSYDGKENIYTPEWSASLRADYQRPLGDSLELRASLDLNFVDNHFITPDLDPVLEQGAYTKINARIGIGSADGSWDVALVGKNLTDELTASFGNDVSLANGAYWKLTDRPRSVAVQGRYRF